MAPLHIYTDPLMSLEIKTRALVLQRYPFRERSWIVRLHTESEGTLNAMLTGKKGTAILPGSLLQVRLHIRSQREVQRLSEIEWDHLYRRFFHDPVQTAYLLLTVEWLSQSLHGPDRNLFAWIREQLILLDCSETPQEQIRYFLSGLLTRLGGEQVPQTASVPEIEAAYRRLFPDWKPVRSIELATFVSL